MTVTSIGISVFSFVEEKSFHISGHLRGSKSTSIKRNFFFHLPTARFCPKNETPDNKIFSPNGKKERLRKPEAYTYKTLQLFYIGLVSDFTPIGYAMGVK